MKIIKIVHYRCSEWQAASYLIPPKDRTDTEIESDIRQVVEQYIQRQKEYNKQKPVNPNWSPVKLEAYDKDMTIGELIELRKKQLDEYQEWSKKKEEAEISFVDHMRKLGYRALWEVEEDEIELYYAEWGHNHGITIKYGE